MNTPVASRLERHRLANTDAVPDSYEQMRDVLDQLLRA